LRDSPPNCCKKASRATSNHELTPKSIRGKRFESLKQILTGFSSPAQRPLDGTHVCTTQCAQFGVHRAEQGLAFCTEPGCRRNGFDKDLLGWSGPGAHRRLRVMPAAVRFARQPCRAIPQRCQLVGWTRHSRVSSDHTRSVKVDPSRSRSANVKDNVVWASRLSNMATKMASGVEGRLAAPCSGRL